MLRFSLWGIRFWFIGDWFAVGCVVDFGCGCGLMVD